MLRTAVQRLWLRLTGVFAGQRPAVVEPPGPTAPIRAARSVYVAHRLDEMRLFDAADRLASLFATGRLPISSGAAGAALEAYVNSQGSHLSGDERRGLYGRVLGEADTGTGNLEFRALWLRFVESVDAYARAVVSGDQAAADASDLRRAARELAANLSVAGAGRGTDAARRLDEQTRAAAVFLSNHAVVAAYGAGSMWQLVERVAERELGDAVNVARHRELADAGATILDWLSERTPEPEDGGVELSTPALKAGATPRVRGLDLAASDGDLAAACVVILKHDQEED